MGKNAVERGAGPGRPKGSVNFVTADIRRMLSEALTEIGGTDYFVQQAHQNPVAFMSLISKLLPREISGPNAGPIQMSGPRSADVTAEVIACLQRKHAAIDAGTLVMDVSRVDSGGYRMADRAQE